MNSSRILFVMALEEEGVLLPTEIQRLITGIGKINAAMKLAHYLSSYPGMVEQVINLGSAGGIGIAKGHCISVNHTVQFDMDVSPLGFERFETPFDALDDQVRVNSDAISNLGLPQAPCFTSDRFVAGNALPPAPALVDMEAYALAKTCAHFNVSFSAIKYVTDQADAQATQDWGDQLETCGQALSRIAAAITSAAS